jgi:integrase
LLSVLWYTPEFDGSNRWRSSVAYRHGLRASEVVVLRWDDIDLTTGRLHVRRAKGGDASVPQRSARDSRALRKLLRESPALPYVFISERRAPLSAAGYQRMVARAGVAAKFTFSIHSHMLRHACGFKFLSLNEHRGKTRRAASMRIIAAPAPVFLMGVSHSKPASIQSSM